MANGFFNFQQGFPGNIFVIRIILPTGEATDWRIESDISFHDVLDVLNRVMPTVSPTAFEYEDEEGDRITVRSDDELQAMIQWVDVEAAPTPQAKREGSGGGSSGRKQPGDIQNILSSGQVYQQDIHNLELMGFGNAGTVYKCLHIPTQRIIATKVIPLNVSVEVQRQIISELDILFQCNSPFVIGFHGAFFTESKISICTEYMNGGSLDTYGVIPEAVLAKISVSVVKGLVYLWNLKVMHRDVKPSNMLVNTDGKVKLCDFGVSIQLVNSIAKTYVGTNAYMAPERISGEEYGIHSDIWSLGISFAEMATGHFPYASDTRKQDDDLRVLPIDLLQCIVHEEPIPLSREQFGNDFVDFVSRCLSKAPHYRPNPEQLLEHALIKKNDDNKDDVIAAFVAQRLAEREGMEH
eukprot:gene5980-11343_t